MQGLSAVWKQHRWTLMLMVLLSIGTLSQAAHEGRTFIVDPQASQDENDDGDFHFNSLNAVFDSARVPHAEQNDLIVLKPGIYEETVDINVPGVTVRSQNGRHQTHWTGAISISAKQVTLEGLDVNAAGQSYGIVVQAPRVTIKQIRVSGAAEAGIRLDHAPFAVLHQLDFDNNSGVGLLAEDADELSIVESRFQANGEVGAKLLHLRNASVSNTRFSLNGIGLQLEDVQQGQVLDNSFVGNLHQGLYVLASAYNDILLNEFENNGEFGMVLENSVQNKVASNTFMANGGTDVPSGGLLLQQASLQNQIEENTFTGHSDLAGSGIELRGPAAANRISGNTIKSNQIGIRLNRDEAGTPQSNLISNNLVEGANREGIFSEGKNNTISENTLMGNNGPGIYLSRSEGETIQDNTITGNNKSGIYATESRQLKLWGNTITGNLNGVEAKHLNDSELQGNLIEANYGKGVRITGGVALKLVNNTFQANHEDGLWLENTEQTTLSGNVFTKNADVGLQLEHARNTKVYDNRFYENQGGMTVWGGERVVAQFNDFISDGAFGLWAMDAVGLDARYNFWGSGEGPSGLSPTRNFKNDVVREVELDAVFPWLPQTASQVIQRSVKGWFFEQKPEQPLHHAPQACVSLELTGLEVNNGWLTVFAPQARPDHAPPLGEELHLFGLSAGGQIDGTIKLVIPYDPEALTEQTSETELRLFVWDGTAWQEHNGTVDVQSHTVSSEIPVEALTAVSGAPVILALPQRRELTRSAWVVGGREWIVGEPFDARLSDPDKNLDSDRLDRLLGTVQLLDRNGTAMLVLDAVETTPNSGTFAIRWPERVTMPLSDEQRFLLRYVDPEAAEDLSETELKIIPRAPFVVNSHLPESEDTNYDFQFQTFEAIFDGTPSVQAGETIRLMPGEYFGAWEIDVPGVTVVADPGVRLAGSLALLADDITLTGFEVQSADEVGVRAQGDGIVLQDMIVKGEQTALSVGGQAFSMQNTRVEGRQIGIEIQGNNAKIHRNTIIGTPALVSGGVLSVERNWWGSPDGPREDVQGVTQEDVFPWLLAPPVGSFSVARVDGATWSRHSVWKILSEMGQALLALDFKNLWLKTEELFGQGGSNFTVSSSWSLRVNASQSGRFILTQDAENLAPWMPESNRRIGLWVHPMKSTSLSLFYQGEQAPQVWLNREDRWVELKVVRVRQDRWRVHLPRLLDKFPLPLWFVVSHL